MRTAPMMDFPLEEYEDRIAKLRLQMKELDVDGVMITGEENTRYFCGLQSIVWGSRISTPGVLLVNKDGEMALIGSKSAMRVKAETSCVDLDYISCNSRLNDPGVPATYSGAICAAFKRLGIDKGRIGFESGPVTRLHMNYGCFLELKALMPSVEWVQFSKGIWNLRSVKSKREIEIFRRLCTISGKCFEKAFSSIHFGKTTEREFYEIFAAEAFRLGADKMPPLIVQFGQGRYVQLNCPPSNKVITNTKHDFIFADTGPSMKGYITDTIRMAVIGGMDEQQAELYKMVVDGLDNCLSLVEPGVPCAEISSKLDKMVADRGFDDVHWTKFWVGHGVGLDVHELPTLSYECDMVLKPGMILSVEPMMLHKDKGMIAIEHNILVTEDGYENLTPYLPELLVL